MNLDLDRDMLPEAEQALEAALGVRFRDLRLLRLALTHRSYVHEHPQDAPESNERLEFLGDALLGFVVAEELYRRFPDLSEGRMTALRSNLVRSETLAQIAARMHLGEHLHLGQGEEKSGGRTRERNLARALEAVVGAILLDQGYGAAKRHTLKLFTGLLHPSLEESIKDYKSLLQIEVQAKGRPAPSYRTVAQQGPAHRRLFTMDVTVEGQVLAGGVGATKRAAEQEAAREALSRLIQEEASDAR